MSLTRFTWYEWESTGDGNLTPQARGEVFIDLNAVVSVGPDNDGVRLVTTSGSSAYVVSGAEAVAALGISPLKEIPTV